MTDQLFATRRRLLTTGGSVALLSIAGCLGDDEEDGNGDSDADGAAGENATDDEDENEDDHADEDHEDLVANVALVDRETDEEVADLHDAHWHGDLPPISLDGLVSLEGVFEDGDREEIPVGEDEEYQFAAELTEGAQEGIVGVQAHGDHVDWESPVITAEVVEEGEDHADDDEHDHGGNESDD